MSESFGNAVEPSLAVPQTRGLIRNHVEGWAAFKIFIVNLLLMVVTLGIYRFWGKTRMRRYLWGHVEILGDRLEYTGTGKELFLGFLVIFAVVLLPLAFLSGFLEQALVGADDGLVALLGLGQMIVVVFLIGMAMFRARRYRLTRTHWRGIYGGQTGSSVKYSLMILASYVLTGLTLGWAWPACSVWLKRYEMAHTWVGDEQPEFTPSIKTLYGSYWIVWLLGFFALGLPLVLAVMSGLNGEAGTLAQNEWVSALDSSWFFSLLPVGFFVGILVYRGVVLDHFVSSTRFHGHTLTSSMTGFGFMWLVVTNALLVIVTVGLGIPYSYKRYLNFVERHIGLQGSGDFSTLLQSTQDKPSRGEGLADAFDIGGI